MRIESPLSKRWSVWASEVRIATFCLHDHVHDRPRVRRRAVGGLALLRLEPASSTAVRLPSVLFEQKVAAVGRKELEDQVHDLVEHGREVVGRDERLGDLDEDLEDVVLVRDVQRRALRLAVESESGTALFSSPKSRLNSAIGRMRVEVESTTRSPLPGRRRSRRGSAAGRCRSARGRRRATSALRHGLVVDPARRWSTGCRRGPSRRPPS